MQNSRVIVIGAGVAGLTTARELARSGRRVTVLEARDRLGGRILTVRPNDCPLRVELGAEFFHGQHPELQRMADDAGLLRCEITGEHRYAVGGQLRAEEDLWEKTQEILQRMDAQQPDRSFSEFLRDEFREDHWNEAASWATAYVEGFNAADQERVSVHWLANSQKAAEEIGEDHQFWIVNGFGTLVEHLASELSNLSVDVVVNSPVEKITWRTGSVNVQTARSSFDAEAAVITVPLGVLQVPSHDPGGIRIEPAPTAHRNAIHRLATGCVVRITLQCKEPFWTGPLPNSGNAAAPELSFLHAREAAFPTWWTAYPLQAPLLTAWVGGPKAAALADATEAEQVDTALRTLAAATGLSRAAIEAQVVRPHLHNWQRDPFARGSYSWVPAGAMDALETLAEPCEGTLFFAGEATDTTGHNGTVHGALVSGLRAARQILELE